MWFVLVTVGRTDLVAMLARSLRVVMFYGSDFCEAVCRVL